MAINSFLTNCNVGCAAQTALPALPEDPYCVSAPNYSQIHSIVISPCASEDAFLEDTGDAVIGTAIDNTNAANTTPRLLYGKGGVAEHEVTEYEGPGRRNVISLRGYTITHEISLNDPLMYEFLRRLQCNYRQFRFWYIDLAEYLYGPIVAAAATTYGGIIPSYVNVQMPKGEGRDDQQVATLEIRFESRTGDPPRWASPLPSGAALCEPAGD